MAKHTPTAAQQSAIDERSRTLLVCAGAGAGKTTTLTHRIIASLLDKKAPASLSRTLVATFTTAAAADLRAHIEAALDEAIKADPKNRALALQKAQLPHAAICTLDSYFYQLLKRNADAAGLSPDFRIADDAEIALLKNATLDHLIALCLSGQAPDVASGDAFARLAEDLTAVRSERTELREVLAALHDACANFSEGPLVLKGLAERIREGAQKPFSESAHGRYILSQTEGLCHFLAGTYERAILEATEAGALSAAAESLMRDEVAKLKNIENLTKRGYTPTKEALSLDIFASLPSKTKEAAPALCADREAVKKALRDHAQTFYSYKEEDIAALCVRMADKVDVLFCFESRFDTHFRQSLADKRVCDFPTMERILLSLLENEDGTPTDTARRIAASLDFLYIDEYQDINPIQHRIIEAISSPRNRFMVGDIKQSIYGFRRADPTLFAAMKGAFAHLQETQDSPYAALYLSENFRSDGTVIDFINTVFDFLFGQAGQSIGYSREDDRLICGKKTAGEKPPHVHFIVPTTAPAPENDDDEEDEEASEKTPARLAEAAFAAQKIKDVLAEKNPDGTPKYTYGDIALLLRTRRHAAAYIEALEAQGIPTCAADRKDFFLQKEILLCLCLLNTINNPLRDIYTGGLMLSPLFSFSADDLVRYRSALPKDYPLWQSMKAYASEHPAEDKLRRFMEQIERYRQIAESTPVDRLLRRLFKETGLLALSGKEGSAGRTNLLLLYEKSRTFEGAAYLGLHGFIDFINQMIEAGTTFERPKENAQTNAVQVMTVHSSKGLEFPVCLLCECGQPLLSKKDASSHFLMHGSQLCALEMRDATGFARVKNPLYEATKDAICQSRIEEEVRVLYVALTRAKERLYITAAQNGNTKPETVLAAAERLHRFPCAYGVLHSRSFFALLAGALGLKEGGYVSLCEANGTPNEAKTTKTPPIEKDDAIVEELRRRFSYVYPHTHLRALPAKLSVSELSPAVLDGTKEEVFFLPQDRKGEQTDSAPPAVPAFIGAQKEADSAAKGTATHLFLQFCDLKALKEKGVEAEAARLVQRKLLRPAEAEALYKRELDAFVSSPLFAQMEQAVRLHRELRFHVWLPAADLTSDTALKEKLQGERVLVQGVIDCILENKDGTISLFDYKTDRLTAPQRANDGLAKAKLFARHGEQLSYYKKAVSLIFGKTPSQIGIYATQTAKLYTADADFPL